MSCKAGLSYFDCVPGRLNLFRFDALVDILARIRLPGALPAEKLRWQGADEALRVVLAR